MALIELKKIEKTYYTDDIPTPVLHSMTFSIDQGEFVAVMGPSGSGKSTLLHILGLLDRQTGGGDLFHAKRNDDYTDDELAKIRNKQMGFVFQAFNLLPRTTVLDNVRLPLLYSNVPEREWQDRTLRAIDAVGLSHRIYHESAQLSGGEKQRVAIARSLINTPQVIFADEPTGNLDSKSGKTVMEILEKLNRDSGHTIILITHETYTAEHAGRIIHLLDGTIERDEMVQSRQNARQFIK